MAGARGEGRGKPGGRPAHKAWAWAAAQSCLIACSSGADGVPPAPREAQVVHIIPTVPLTVSVGLRHDAGRGLSGAAGSSSYCDDYPGTELVDSFAADSPLFQRRLCLIPCAGLSAQEIQDSCGDAGCAYYGATYEYDGSTKSCSVVGELYCNRTDLQHDWPAICHESICGPVALRPWWCL